jgi:hypothetical protein
LEAAAKASPIKMLARTVSAIDEMDSGLDKLQNAWHGWRFARATC